VTSWQELRDEAASCTRCDLYQRATQTVFGEGQTAASMGTAEDASLGSWRGLVAGTIHPSAVLRGPDQEDRDRAYAGLVADLVAAREAAAEAAR